jgi:tetratricopeptide (TPR) repeat protein
MNRYPPSSLVNDRYEVAAHPLIGGMGIVYLCLDREKDIPVALKTFKPEYLPDRDARDRFLREGTIWMDLGSNAHIVRCYGVENINYGTEVFLVLEQVTKEPGREDASLRSWLEHGRPLPIDQALLFALQIARGMRHVTSRIHGFVHRDLKPENVLVGTDKLTGTSINRLRITDFGLAHVLNNVGERSVNINKSDSPVVGNRTQLGRGIVGTPFYMAPEQWTGEPLSVATDVYALGCILYEMLAGRTLVRGNSIDELKFNHNNRKFGPMPSGLPEGVISTIKRCLSSDRRNRFRDWVQVATRFESAYQSLTGKTAPVEETAMALSRADQVALGWGYGHIGNSYMDMGKIETALSYFERMEAIGIAQKENLLEAGALNNLGVAYSELGQVQRAFEFHKRSLKIKYELGDSRAIMSSLENLGISYAKLGDTKRSIQACEDALILAREIGDRHAEGRVLSNLGVTYRDLHELQKALEYFEQALAIDQETNNSGGVAENLHNMADVYAKQGKFGPALHLVKEASQLWAEIGSPKVQKARILEGRIMNGSGESYRGQEDFHKAIECYDQALAIARETSDRKGEGATLNNFGIVYFSLGDNKRAITYYEQALAIDREIENMEGAAKIQFNMASVYSEEGDLTRALSLAQEASRILTTINSPNARQAQEFVLQLNETAKKQKAGFFGGLFRKDKNKEMVRLTQMGKKYLEDNLPENSIEVYEKALKIARDIDSQVFECAILYELGKAQEKLSDRRAAIELHERSLTVARKINDLVIVAENLLKLSQLYLLQEDYAHGVSTAQDAAQTLFKLGDSRAPGVQELAANLQSSLAQSKANQEAFTAFLNAASFVEMNMTVRKYPFMTNDDFIDEIERYIDKFGNQVPPERNSMYIQHFTWLKQIANKK